ncbi:MAG: class I SAM-dependent methyltransferase [Candidatus Limnocylindria bacterium]
MSERPIDVDALVAEVKERVRDKRAQGLYGPDVEAALQRPLPGGALASDQLEDALAALPIAIEQDVVYDPRSRKGGLAGVPITFARRAVIWLIRWYLFEITGRQNHINALALRALRDLDARLPTGLVSRVGALEGAKRLDDARENAEYLDYSRFADRFGGLEEQVRGQAEQFLPYFNGRRRVLDVGSGRGTFLTLAKDAGIGAYGVDVSPQLVEQSRGEGLEVYQIDAEEHLRSLPDASLDGIFAVHFAEHVVPGHLFEILHECKRVLVPGSHCVMATPNPRTLTVGAHTFWLDPTHRKPLPPDAFQFYLQVSGFEPVTIHTYNPSDERLSEEGLEGPALANARLLNETLFGDRDYAVVGMKP